MWCGVGPTILPWRVIREPQMHGLLLDAHKEQISNAQKKWLASSALSCACMNKDCCGRKRLLLPQALHFTAINVNCVSRKLGFHSFSALVATYPPLVTVMSALQGQVILLTWMLLWTFHPKRRLCAAAQAHAAGDGGSL